MRRIVVALIALAACGGTVWRDIDVRHVEQRQQVFVIVTGKAFTPSSLITGAVLAIVYVVIAAMFFMRVYRQAVRTGLIARYSAESLS